MIIFRLGSMIEAVILDFDGVLVDTPQRQYRWFKHWAKENGKELPYSNFDEFLDDYNDTIDNEGVQAFYDKWKLPCDMDNSNHEVWDAYKSYIQSHPLGLYPGIKEVVEEIWKLGNLTENPEKNKRIRIGINSSSPWANIYPSVQEILPYIDSFVTKETLEKEAKRLEVNSKKLMKPSPHSVNLILDLLSVSNANNVMHIGDTRDDLRASHNFYRFVNSLPQKVDLITIGACYGFEGRNRLKQGVETIDGMMHFDELIDKPEEILDIFKKYNE